MTFDVAGNDHTERRISTLVIRQRELLDACQSMLKTISDQEKPLGGAFEFLSSVACIGIQGRLSELTTVLNESLPQDVRKNIDTSSIDSGNAYLARMQQVSLEFMRQSITLKAYKNAVTSVKRTIQSLSTSGESALFEIPDLHELLSNTLDEMVIPVSDEEVKNHPDYKAFVSLLGTNTENNGEDAVVVQSSEGDIPTKCGITRLDIVHPVKSDICGHIFSKEGIEHLFRGYGSGFKAKCPMIGCGKMLKRSDFRSSASLKAYVNINRERAERQRNLRRNIAESQSIHAADDV